MQIDKNQEVEVLAYDIKLNKRKYRIIYTNLSQEIKSQLK